LDEWPKQSAELNQQLSDHHEGVKSESITVGTSMVEENVLACLFKSYSTWKLRRLVAWIIHFGKADKLIAKDVQQRLSGQGEAIQERIVAANRRTTQSLRLQHKAPNGIGWKASSHRDDHLPLTSH
ncbi:hypothetical protein P5673_018213, partial [Acropora cervicornis]